MAKKYTLDQIYTAAIPIFARYGYKRARVEDIAEELEMVPGTLYRYVKDKRQLYENAVTSGLEKWQARVGESLETTDDPKEQFLLLCTQSYHYLAEDTDMRSILTNDPSIFPLSPRKVRFPKIDNTSLEMIKHLLKTGIEKGVFREVDVEQTAEFLYSIYVMFIIKTYVKSESSSSSQMYENGIDLILNGLMKPGK